jgi:hypothetical protein
MKRNAGFLGAMLLILAVQAGQAQAQGMTRVGPLDPHDPRAMRATEATEALLTADVEEALRRLADITLASARGQTFNKQVEDVIRAIGRPDAFRVGETSPGPGGVMVLLVPEGAGQAMGLIVEMDPGEPHYLSGIRIIPVQLRNPGT